MTMPNMMKAITFDQAGDAGVLRYSDAPMPSPQENELLVKVHAAALNRADLLQRRGAYPPPEGASPILGLEVAGEVVTPSGDFAVGDRVMAVITGGGYAQYATVPVGMAIRIPRAHTYQQAAAITEAYLTAWLNLVTLCAVQSGESVLIHAGASGVGSAAIQLAKTLGATVYATAGSAEKCAFCVDLGAAHAINYRTQNFRDQIAALTDNRGVNVILDFIGAPYWAGNLASLALDGRLALIGFLGGSAGSLDLAMFLRKRITVYGNALRSLPIERKAAVSQAFAAYALPHFENDTLRPVIDRVFPLQDAAQAHAYMETNANIGKIVLTVDHD
jgi:tumor protein p53-inducible protein 3